MAATCIIIGRTTRTTRTAAEAAAAAIAKVPDAIAPFPGGIVRSGSKVGSKYKGARASTNDAFCPTLRGAVKSSLDAEAGSVLEIVIDGLTSEAVAAAMRAGIAAIVKLGPAARRHPHQRGKLRRQARTASLPSAGFAAVKPLVLTLRQRPEQRLDLSPLVPHRLAGKTATEIERIEVQTTRWRVTVGEIFRLKMGDAEQIRIEGACDRLDHVGQAMTGGDMLVEGDVGVQAGRLMAGGRLTVRGNAGPYAASGMTGGGIEISGAAGDFLGGPLAGEMAGMRGGIVVVRGRAGARAGDRMRRGTIVIEGEAGAYPGSRMIAGTLIVGREAGALPGFLMKRGTIVLGDGTAHCRRHSSLPARTNSSPCACWRGSSSPTASEPPPCCGGRCGGLPGTWRYWERASCLSETGTKLLRIYLAGGIYWMSWRSYVG